MEKILNRSDPEDPPTPRPPPRTPRNRSDPEDPRDAGKGPPGHLSERSCHGASGTHAPGLIRLQPGGNDWPLSCPLGTEWPAAFRRQPVRLPRERPGPARPRSRWCAREPGRSLQDQDRLQPRRRHTANPGKATGLVEMVRLRGTRGTARGVVHLQQESLHLSRVGQRRTRRDPPDFSGGSGSASFHGPTLRNFRATRVGRGPLA